jgi:hypothetical protein
MTHASRLLGWDGVLACPTLLEECSPHSPELVSASERPRSFREAPDPYHDRRAVPSAVGFMSIRFTCGPDQAGQLSGQQPAMTGFRAIWRS